MKLCSKKNDYASLQKKKKNTQTFFLKQLLQINDAAVNSVKRIAQQYQANLYKAIVFNQSKKILALTTTVIKTEDKKQLSPNTAEK